MKLRLMMRFTMAMLLSLTLLYAVARGDDVSPPAAVTLLVQRASELWGTVSRTTADAVKSPSATLTRTASSLLYVANSSSATLSRTLKDVTRSPLETLTRTASRLLNATRSKTTVLTRPSRLLSTAALSSLAVKANSGYMKLVRAQSSLQDAADSPYETLTATLEAAKYRYPKQYAKALDVIAKAGPQVELLRKKYKRGSDEFARWSRRVKRITLVVKILRLFASARRAGERLIAYILDISRPRLEAYKLPVYRCDKGRNCKLEKSCVLGLRMLCVI